MPKLSQLPWANPSGFHGEPIRRNPAPADGGWHVGLFAEQKDEPLRAGSGAWLARKTNQMNSPNKPESPASVALKRMVSTFDEEFRDGEYRRAGIEVNTRAHRVRLGWIRGHIPTFFFAGGLASHKQKQVRVWRLAISYCANDDRDRRPGTQDA